MKNSGYLSRRSRRSRHTFLRLAFCSVVRFFGTTLAHNFLMSKLCFKIWWTVNRFKFNSLLIILNVNRRSDLTRNLTLSTLLSVFEVEGLPAQGSSSTYSRPSEKDLCHLNTCALDQECSPQALCKFSLVTVADSPSFTQNLMAQRFSNFWRSIFVTHLTNTTSLQTLPTIA